MSTTSIIQAGRSPQTVGLFLVLAAALLAADLGLKWWSFQRFPDQPVDAAAVVAGEQAVPPAHRNLVPSLLSLKLTVNEGAVFGLGQGRRWLFVLFTIVAMAIVGWTFATSGRRQWVFHVSLALVLAGAVGNLYDRILYGGVRDMLWLLPGVELPFGWTWPGGTSDAYPWLFNLADVMLLVGIGMILIRLFFGPAEDAGPSAEAPADQGG